MIGTIAARTCLRDIPSSNTNVSMFLNQSDVVNILDDHEGWFLVEKETARGWCRSENVYISPDDIGADCIEVWKLHPEINWRAVSRAKVKVALIYASEGNYLCPSFYGNMGNAMFNGIEVGIVHDYINGEEQIEFFKRVSNPVNPAFIVLRLDDQIAMTTKHQFAIEIRRWISDVQAHTGKRVALMTSDEWLTGHIPKETEWIRTIPRISDKPEADIYEYLTFANVPGIAGSTLIGKIHNWFWKEYQNGQRKTEGQEGTLGNEGRTVPDSNESAGDQRPEA